MSDTIPNIIVEQNTITDIYANAGVIAAGVEVGTKINVEMIGSGTARLYSGASLTINPNDETGYSVLKKDVDSVNETGDLGAFIWSLHGCTINVSEV